ncbi:glycosyltransferase [bacterium]|nr:glycosyltransferase [bacterium]
MIRALAEQPGVEVHADVPDMRPLFARATLYAVPLRVGGGMRLKILEAMAMGKAVVSTTLGAEGLEYTPGRQLLPADDAEIFAAQVVRLCRNAEARQSLEREARDWVVRHYTWDAVMGRLEKVYQDMEYNAHFLRKTSARVR